MALDLAAARAAIQRLADPLGMSVTRRPGASTRSSTRTWRTRPASTRSSAARIRGVSALRVRWRRAGPRLPRRHHPARPASDRAARRWRRVDDRLPGAPLAFDFVRSSSRRSTTLDWARVNARFAEMEDEGDGAAHASGLRTGEIWSRAPPTCATSGRGTRFECRCRTGHSVGVRRRWWGASTPSTGGSTGASPTGAARDRQLARRCARPEADPRPARARAGLDRRRADGAEGQPSRLLPQVGEHRQTPVYDRYQLGPGASFDGPAIVEERESTVVVGPGARATVDESLNLIVRYQHAR